MIEVKNFAQWIFRVFKILFFLFSFAGVIERWRHKGRKEWGDQRKGLRWSKITFKNNTDTIILPIQPTLAKIH